jgi:hypothetical protein
MLPRFPGLPITSHTEGSGWSLRSHVASGLACWLQAPEFVCKPWRGSQPLILSPVTSIRRRGHSGQGQTLPRSNRPSMTAVRLSSGVRIRFPSGDSQAARSFGSRWPPDCES